MRLLAQGYCMLLWACPVSLLGLAYLLLISSLLVAPPQRGRYAERDAQGHFLERPSRTPALILTIQRYTLGVLTHTGYVLAQAPSSFNRQRLC